MTRANEGTYSRQVGDVIVTALLDGQFEGTTSLILGPHEKQSEDWLRETSRHVPPRFSVSCFLLEFADESKALFDGGCGHAFGPVAGLAPEALASLGVKPEEIGTILSSHAHPDHVVGLIETDGSARYPNAEMAITEVEHAYWVSDANRDAASDVTKQFFDGARAGLNAYAGKTRHFKDSEEVMLGIEAVFLPGHTPATPASSCDPGRRRSSSGPTSSTCPASSMLTLRPRSRSTSTRRQRAQAASGRSTGPAPTRCWSRASTTTSRCSAIYAPTARRSRGMRKFGHPWRPALPAKLHEIGTSPGDYRDRSKQDVSHRLKPIAAEKAPPT